MIKTFGSILNKFLKIVMGILDKINQPKGAQPQNIVTPAPEQLNAQELEFLLLLIKQSTFKGESLEVVFNTTLKLQTQYTKAKQ
jgi:hypothetical protein